MIEVHVFDLGSGTIKDFAAQLGGAITAEAFDLILRTLKLDVSNYTYISGSHILVWPMHCMYGLFY